jgi:hypothetical protein
MDPAGRTQIPVSAEKQRQINNENAGNMCYSIDNDKQINDQEAAVMEKNKDAKGYRQDGPGQRGDLL